MSLIESVRHRTPESTSIECIVDSKSLYENIHSIKPALEQRQRVDIVAIREMIRQQQLVFTWKVNHHQLTDCLTKRGASSKLLMECVTRG